MNEIYYEYEEWLNKINNEIDQDYFLHKEETEAIEKNTI